MVGDRGMITSARIAALNQMEDGTARPDPYGWITALRALAIKKLMADDGPLQLSLFDQQDLAEITSDDYPGEQLVACRNPVLAADRARKREDLLAATEKREGRWIRPRAGARGQRRSPRSPRPTVPGGPQPGTVRGSAAAPAGVSPVPVTAAPLATVNALPPWWRRSHWRRGRLRLGFPQCLDPRRRLGIPGQRGFPDPCGAGEGRDHLLVCGEFLQWGTGDRQGMAAVGIGGREVLDVIEGSDTPIGLDCLAGYFHTCVGLEPVELNSDDDTAVVPEFDFGNIGSGH